LDYQWLQRQLAGALANAAEAPNTPITLPRSTVELMTCVLDLGHSAEMQPPALASRYHISIDDLRPAVIAEMQRLAAAGDVAPSKSRWDVQRQRTLPTAQHVCRVLAVRWPVLAKEAGLHLSPYARRFADDTGEIDAGEEPASEHEPQQHSPTADYDDWPVVRSRTETVTTGNVRTTREYHMLR
jgi:hypothetical protein